MALSEEQLEELYKTTLENRTDIGWIRERLENGSDEMVRISRRQNGIEKENALLKGKLGAFVIVLSLSATILFNGVGLVLAKFWMG